MCNNCNNHFFTVSSHPNNISRCIVFLITMQVYTLDNHRYYIYDDINKNYPMLTRGCSSKKIFIERNNIPDSCWQYARRVKGEWITTDGKSKTVDKLFVWKKHMDRNMIIHEEKLDPLPDDIILDGDQAFTGPDGEALDVRMVGTRTTTGIYFRMRDVANAFKMKNLCNVVMHSGKDGYKKNIHYRTFIGLNNKCVTYLTYSGLLKILFTTRTLDAQPYAEAIINQLGRFHFGMNNCKLTIAESLLGLNSEIVKPGYGAKNTSCIYLIEIGSVKNLRSSMNIENCHSDSSSVYKWGKTSNLRNRTKSHTKIYSKFRGASLKIIHYILIDEYFLTNFENRVKNMLKKKKYYYAYPHHKELAIIPSDELDNVIQSYEIISKKYARIKKNYLISQTEMELIRLEKIKIMFDTEYNKKITDTKAKLLEYKY